MSACSRTSCFVPDTNCALGYLNLADCPAWNHAESSLAQPKDQAGAILMPWSGRVLGHVDVGFVAGRGKPFIVGVVGPQNSGKTTLLAAWYLLLGHGMAPSPDQSFAGSYSFEGWESVAASLRWAPGAPPTFPAHTSSREGRTPGLLHLAFRHWRELMRDYLFADAPGEWFQEWAINTEAPEAAGARWVSKHADVFLLISDCAALSGSSMGSARGAMQLLVRRLASERGDRPVALVWTKSDIAVSEEATAAVRSIAAVQIPDLKEFKVSVMGQDGESMVHGEGLLDLLGWIVTLRRARPELPAPQSAISDPLFLFGARS